MERAHFEALLARLDPVEDTAALLYEDLRQRLIRYFRWERSAAPEDLADEVLNRVARKLEAGEVVEGVQRYAAGVARVLMKESLTRARRQELALKKRVEPDIEPPVDPDALACLETCLGSLGPEQARLILRYYAGSGSAHIVVRREIAEELGLEINALRNRALRIRERLEDCVRRCLGRNRDALPVQDTQF
jgi:DNA-directed RNA polymerase specialized sigma24 family protein